jgi:HEAT repeat protein
VRACLLSLLWSVAGTVTQGAEPLAHPVTGLLPAPPQFDDLIRNLDDPSPAIRLAAINGLETSNGPASDTVTALAGRFSDPDLLVRACAARAALRLGAPHQQILDVALELIIPDRLDVLRVVTSIFVEIGPDAADALPQLDACLNAFSIAVRLHAAEAMLRIDPNDLLALDELESALDHRQTEVRFFAVNAIGAAVLDSDQAVCALQRALSDRHPKVATAAALQLLRTNGVARHTLPEELQPTPRDIARLISALSHAATDVRQAAAIGLTIAGPRARKAIPVLIDHLGDPNAIVRLHVAQAIWEISQDAYEILPVLLDLLMKDRDATRIGAVYILSRMGTAAADVEPWLTQLLNESKSFDRLLLAQALVQIDPTGNSVLEILVKGSSDRNADVRYLSIAALGLAPLSRQAAIEQPLRAALADRNFHVRCSAREALGHLQERMTLAQNAQRGPLGVTIPAAATGVPK